MSLTTDLTLTLSTDPDPDPNLHQVVQQLLGRVVTRLRALVLLPTRGLAVQVT